MTQMTEQQFLDYIIPRYKANPIGWLGPNFIAIISDAFFIGILCCQVSRYYTTFTRDSKCNKGLVGVCFVLSILKGVESTAVTWQKQISGFGDWGRAVRMVWPLCMDPILLVLLITASQTFFAWRCFTLTNRCWLLLISLAILMSGVIALGVALSLQLARPIPDFEAIYHIAVPLFVFSFVVDAEITGTVWFKLAKARRGTNGTRYAFLSKWIMITYECALPPALSQLATIIVFLTNTKQNDWYCLFNMLTPRLYVFSLMYTLNSRLPMEFTPEPESYGDQSPQGITNGRRSAAGTLSTFKAVNQTFALETYGTVPASIMEEIIGNAAPERCYSTGPTDNQGSGQVSASTWGTPDKSTMV